MASAEAAPVLIPHSFSTSPEIPSDGERQSVLVALLGSIVANEALTADEREAEVAAVREAAGYGTLEFRMLHMFALHAAQMAIDAR